MGPGLRHATIDGIRGYLAIAVLCHHFLIAWIFFQTGVWAKPPVTVVANLGPVAVCLFFMVTAFLFYGKLTQRHALAWSSLYRGRLLRLTPMYFVSVSLVLAIVLVETNFTRNEGYAWARRTSTGSRTPP